jgi:hypothetical protein
MKGEETVIWTVFAERLSGETVLGKLSAVATLGMNGVSIASGSGKTKT